MDIKKLKNNAEKALSRMQGENSYNTKYVLRRLNASVEKYPYDSVIGSVRDVMKKVASKQEFITKKELSKIHGHLSGFNKESMFRDELGDLIFAPHNLDNVSRDASSMRVNQELNITSGLEEGSDLHKMSKEFEGVFNFNKQSFSRLSETANSKAEKFASSQLKSIGMPANEVKAVTSNNHFILCNASFSTSNFDKINVAIPVRVNNGVPEFPQHFVNNGNLEELNKSNLLVHIRASQEENSRSRTNKYASQRDDAFDKTFVNVKSASLEGNQLDDMLLESQSKFAPVINAGRNLIDSELRSFGFRSNNIKYASSGNSSVTYTADIPGFSSDVEIEVSIVNNRPLIPSMFTVAGQKRRFSEFELKKVASTMTKTASSFSAYKKAYSNMSYEEIVAEMSSAAVNKDYKVAEDCLAFLQSKFGSQEYLNALNKFSSILKHSSVDSDREALVKAALHRGELIKTPNSIELYSPKFALPLSKLAFDEKGNLVPARSLRSTESGLSYLNPMTSKIVLT